MKRLFGIFVLTPAEQRVIIFVVLLLVTFALFKHHRDLRYESATPVTPSVSPASND